jgi:hypothetical protein
MTMLNYDPSVKAWWIAVEDADGDGGLQHVLVIETDIELDPAKDGFDKLRLDHLAKVGRGHMASNSHLRRLRLVPIGRE